ncbi:S-methyl-5-thioribose-1-phosphate isomerase [Algiphilus sp.]|uniref:S-methyl-5-thioribose-1-phosphate isomerase n=1 Tax=Algiphilus sp. TaxID=1872431 RepID=UPI003B52B109
MPNPAASTVGVEAIRFVDGALQLLDQRRLPLEERWLHIPDAPAAAQAIHDMVVRGAPAIGITAAYGLALAALQGEDRAAAAARLAASRPTAVNLHWALTRMQGLGAQASPERLLEEARAIHAEDLAQNLRMATEGVGLIGEGARVLTHCNTGALATGGHGTALGVIRSAWRAGRLQAVYHTETRPWLQGARLTAWELASEGIPATMIADAACAQLMAEGQVDWVIVGADRIAANGDTANKIGTRTLAECAHAYGVGFMVVAPSGTIDAQCPDGSRIPIESRSGDELCTLAGHRVAPEGCAAWNPVFDVTPAARIDAIVCERGVARPKQGDRASRLLDEALPG